MQDWDADRLHKYQDFLLRFCRWSDAFWFINVERDHGMEEACRLNELVWDKVGELSVRDLIQRFEITRTGLGGLVEVMEIYPWHLIVGYEMERLENELILSVPSCPPQEARLKRGLGEYPCKSMHRAEFEAMARVVDPSIKVACDFAPPDEHPEELFCRWRFVVMD